MYVCMHACMYVCMCIQTKPLLYKHVILKSINYCGHVFVSKVMDYRTVIQNSCDTQHASKTAKLWLMYRSQCTLYKWRSSICMCFIYVCVYIWSVCMYVLMYGVKDIDGTVCMICMYVCVCIYLCFCVCMMNVYNQFVWPVCNDL